MEVGTSTTHVIPEKAYIILSNLNASPHVHNPKISFGPLPTKRSLYMRLPLLGLGLLAPAVSPTLVIETVWVGTGDCSPTPIGETGGSSAGGKGDGFGAGISAYTDTHGVVDTGIQTSAVASIGSVSVASDVSTVAVSTTNLNAVISTYSTGSAIASTQPVSVTSGTDFSTTTTNLAEPIGVAPSTYVNISSGIGTPTYHGIPLAAGASGRTAAVPTSTSSNDAATTSTTNIFVSSDAIIPTIISSQPASVTVEIENTGTSSPGSTTVAPSTDVTGALANSTESGSISAGTNSGGLAVTSTYTNSFPTTNPQAATNNLPSTATTSSAEPTYSNISPACSDNNTYYIDHFGLQYDIRCGLNFANAGVTLAAHADTFDGCIQYCSLLDDCAGVSFSGTQCTPLANFTGYIPDAGSNVQTAVPTDGPNDGSVTPDDLCAEGFDGQSYTDTFGYTWTILCNQTVAGTALQETIVTNLEACVNYCAFYEGCEALYFEGGNGSVAGGEIRPVANCYPLSSNGTVSQGTFASSAILQGACNVSPFVPVSVGQQMLMSANSGSTTSEIRRGGGWIGCDRAVGSAHSRTPYDQFLYPRRIFSIKGTSKIKKLDPV